MSVDIQQRIIPDAFGYGKKKETNEKCFIGHETDNKIIPLFIKVPLMPECFNLLEKTHYMTFLIKDKKFLEKYISNQSKIENIIKKKFATQPVCKENYLNTKLKLLNGKINTKFYDIEKEPTKPFKKKILMVLAFQ